MPFTVHVLGCGTMGIAILSGVLQSLAAQNSIPFGQSFTNGSQSGISTPMDTTGVDGQDGDDWPAKYIATVGRPESAKRLKRIFQEIPLGEKVQVFPGTENAQAVYDADLVLICCKPQLVHSLIATIPSAAFEHKLVVSICAGVKISQMKEWLPESCVIVRAMPNTPSKIREGMTILTPLPTNLPVLPNLPNPAVTLRRIFSSIGLCRTLEEKHFDACTALSGSGPAFACVILEAMADGGVMMGLPRKEALELAAQTMQGAAKMVLSGLHPAQLKDSVTTPGGCTIAGLLTLEDGRVRSTMARTIQVATQHASGLGQDKK